MKQRIRTPEAVQLRAKELRQVMTPAEKLLWDTLRKKQLDGLKFRRQHPIDPLIVFFCPSAKLVVELDGDIHQNRADQDTDRTEHLQERGFRVIRFGNEEVLHDIERVLDRIRYSLRQPGLDM